MNNLAGILVPRRAPAFSSGLALLLFLFISPCRADAPPVFAIKDARIVTVSSAPIEKGTVVVRDGLIASVGAGIPIPADARVIEGKDLVVYPGLIDATSDIGLPQAATPSGPGGAGPPPGGPVVRGAPPAGGGSAEGSSNLNTFLRVADLLGDGGTRAEAARLAGITTVLVVPTRGIFLGQSALVNLNGDSDTMVVRSPVAMHVRLASTGGFGGGYPGSLMGRIAYVRQSFLDTRRYEECWEIYHRNVRSLRRPETSRALEALLPVTQKKLPLVISASTAPEIMRAIHIGEENDVVTILSGAGEGWKVAATLKEKRLPVLVSVRYPEKPRDADPDREESLRDLQARADAPRNAAELQKAGVKFAFFSDGLPNPRDFIKNVGRAVKAGLPADAALRAMTLFAAEIFGVQEQLGSIELGKIANLVVTDGDLFAEKTKIRTVFVDGKRYEAAAEESKPVEAPRITLTGRWTLNFDLGGFQAGPTLQLTQSGNDLTGTAMTRSGSATPISDGVVSGREFRLKWRTQRGEMETTFALSGTLEGETMRGTVSLGGRDVSFTGTRAPG